MQIWVLMVSLIFMAVIAYFFVATIKAVDGEDAVDPNDRRGKLIWGMLIAGIVITTASLWSWPHAVSDESEAIVVNATGAQWSWDIDNEELPLGKPVVFNVHTEDVTHGLGVVDETGRLLFQAQAIPGYVNKVEYVFSKAGEYRVICMEYCGLAHHDMTTEFTVGEQ